jgi:hypothetical protein
VLLDGAEQFERNQGEPMRQISIAILAGITVVACADIDEPSTAEHADAVTALFGETWDDLRTGSVDGQNGWAGDCRVTDGARPNKYLTCAGDRSATKVFGRHGAGSYSMQFDIGPDPRMVDATHGTIALDGPQGRAFRITLGCEGIRAGFQADGPSASLGTFECGTLRGPPRFRVLCRWSTGGTVLTCGASELPVEPTRFVILALPSGMRPFSTVAISTLALPGATLFDNIHVRQH